MSDNKPSDDRKRDRVPPPPPRPGDRRNRPGGDEGPQLPKGRFGGASRSLAFWAIFILLGVIGYQLLSSQAGQQVELKYTEFKTYLEQGAITEITVVGKTKVQGRLRNPISKEVGGQTRTYTEFRVTFLEGVIDSQMLDDWSEKAIELSFEEDATPWLQFLFQSLPYFLRVVASPLLHHHARGDDPQFLQLFLGEPQCAEDMNLVFH